MRQNLFKSAAVVLVAVAMLAGSKSAKADIVGIGLGYRFEPSRIAIDFLIPLKHHGAKRPQGGVLNLGLDIRGGFRKRDQQGTNFDWIGFSLPVAYEHVFDNGISIITGAEFLYFSNNEDYYSDDRSRTFASSEKRTDYGGGIVLGTHYFFKGGAFLGFRVSAGVGHATYAYNRKTDYPESSSNADTEANEGHTAIYGYASPTFSVGYMF